MVKVHSSSLHWEGLTLSQLLGKYTFFYWDHIKTLNQGQALKVVWDQALSILMPVRLEPNLNLTSQKKPGPSLLTFKA
jgi:hypothetical protein